MTPPIWTLANDAEVTTGPKTKPARAPLLIHDAVTPWGNETLLLKLLRDQAADQDE
ncbi:hypothetical protein [Ruegeria arenilitoris]|uniref:hypothetical protein n=1 Tax=Ruegeria arenilitoris TaxID=1173585 RepID=UPI0020C32979|nr:hypothetical protein [Ruegeria arenilitoris]